MSTGDPIWWSVPPYFHYPPPHYPYDWRYGYYCPYPESPSTTPEDFKKQLEKLLNPTDEVGELRKEVERLRKLVEDKNAK